MSRKQKLWIIIKDDREVPTHGKFFIYMNRTLAEKDIETLKIERPKVEYKIKEAFVKFKKL